MQDSGPPLFYRIIQGFDWPSAQTNATTPTANPINATNPEVASINATITEKRASIPKYSATILFLLTIINATNNITADRTRKTTSPQNDIASFNSAVIPNFAR